jgi:hypothetical protein
VEKDGTLRQATDDNAICLIRFACWITKAVYIHSEYVIIIAFPRRKRLRERASDLCYKHIACLVFNTRYQT